MIAQAELATSTLAFLGVLISAVLGFLGVLVYQVSAKIGKPNGSGSITTLLADIRHEVKEHRADIRDLQSRVVGIEAYLWRRGEIDLLARQGRLDEEEPK